MLTRYDAFISYSHEADKDLAPAIQRALQRLGKPWYRRRALHVYRDQTDLAANPDLWGSIEQALDESRWFVLLASPRAAASEWVAKEIEHWRSTHAASDDDRDPRIVVVVTGGTWAWDDEGGDFDWEGDRSTAIPRSLGGAFEKVPYVIPLRQGDHYAESDVRDPGFHDAAASVAAAIRGESKDKLVGEDLRQHRRTLQVAWGAVVLLALLALTASVAGVTAAVNASRADREREQAERSEIRALAQADAAEAVLAAHDSPALAIDLAVHAAQRSDSPTVRSAMLSVSQEAQRLVRALAYPVDDAGHPPDAASYDLDGTQLMAWGPARHEDESFLQIWRLDRLGVRFSRSVAVRDLQEVVMLGDDSVVGCSSDGPVMIDVGSDETGEGDGAEQPSEVAKTGQTDRHSDAGETDEPMVTVLDERWNEQLDAGCSLLEFAGGVVAHPIAGTGEPARRGWRTYYVDRRGHVTTIDDITTVAAHHASGSALVAGERGITVVAPGGAQQVSSEPSRASRFADRGGRFLVEIGGARWAIVEPGAAGHTVRELPVPASAVEVAPVIDYSTMAGDVAWIEDDGTIGWTRDGQRTQVFDTQPDPRLAATGVWLEPTTGERLVAVTGNTATILDVPVDSLSARARGRPAGWHATVVEASVGKADGTAADAVEASCSDHLWVVLAAGDGALLIGGYEQNAVPLDGRGTLTPDCKVLDLGESLSVVDDLNGRSLVRANFVWDGLAPSPIQDEAAILRDGRPIEIVSLAPEADLPTPWAVHGSSVDPLPPGFGEQIASVERTAEGFELVFVEPGREVGRVRLRAADVVVATSPNGSAAVVEDRAPGGGERRYVTVDGEIDAVDPTCANGEISFAPDAGFENDLEAAEAQVPVHRREDGSMVSCLDGTPHRIVRGERHIEVLFYEPAGRRGRVVTRAGGRPAKVTMWERSRPQSLRSVIGPRPATDETDYAFDERAEHAVTWEPGSRALTVHRRVGRAWEIASTADSGLGTVVDATLVDEGTLLLVVSNDGGFELYDTSTGRRVAYDIAPGPYEPQILGIISARVVDDHLYTNLSGTYSPTGGGPTMAGLDIPIGIGALTVQLCTLYAAPACPS